MRLPSRNIGRLAVPRSAFLVVAALVAALLAACSGSHGGSAAGTVSYAEEPGQTPNYILPFESPNFYTGANSGLFSYMFYPPLYWFGQGSSPDLNENLSLAYPPVFTNGGKTVLLKLKPYRWSNGKPVTSRDIAFWQNLLVANASNWGASVPNEFPYNIQSERIVSPTEYSITFKKVYNRDWLIYNELSQVFPIPQAAWDKTSVSSPIGNYDTTASGARAVYKFLDAQSRALSSYTTNPLWKVVDGPFKLSQFNGSTGYATLVPNAHYSGKPKPTISKLILQPYTSDTAELDALRAGEVDYGYLPFSDQSQKGYFKSRGYQFQPWDEWGITYMPINFTNPTTGPILRQAYIRQAMQSLIDQKTYVTKIFMGYATPGDGPVPNDLSNQFLDKQQSQDPYPYNVGAARSLLTSHGWHLSPGSVSTCIDPGSGPSQCGAGVARGARLNFSLLYASGNPAVQSEMAAIQSSYSLVGIKLNLTQAPTNTVFADSVPCVAKSGTGCSWSLMDWGQQWGYNLDFYPSGGEIFFTGALANYGGYSSSTMDQLILATDLEPGMQPMYKYENFTAKELPVLWLPESATALSEIKNNISGVDQTPILEITPQYWRVGG